MKRRLESLHSGSEEETAKEVARELTAEDQQAAKGQLIYVTGSGKTRHLRTW